MAAVKPTVPSLHGHEKLPPLKGAAINVNEHIIDEKLPLRKNISPVTNADLEDNNAAEDALRHNVLDDSFFSAAIGDGIRRKQACRCLVSFLLLIFGIVLAPLVISRAILRAPRVSYQFDAQKLLSLQVGGCAVEIHGCDEVKASFAAYNSDARAFGLTQTSKTCDREGLTGWVTLDRAATSVAYTASINDETYMIESLGAKNTSPNMCPTPPLRTCETQCRVIVQVPTSTKEVLVMQDPEDRAPEGSRVRVSGHVTLERVTVSGHFINLEVDGADITDALWAATGKGVINVQRSNIGSGSRLKSALGSVFLILPDNSLYSADVYFRSPSSFGCFSATTPNATVTFDPNGPWEDTKMEIASISQRTNAWPNCIMEYPGDELGSTVTSACAKSTIKFYDTDSNLKISDRDLSAGIENLNMCCGPKCPFSSSCTYTYTNEIFPWPPAPISAFDFVDMIVKENSTMLVPGLHRLGKIEIPRSKETRTFYVTSDQGTVFVAHGGEPGKATRVSHTYSISRGEGYSNSIKLAKDDIAALHSEVRDVYGNGPSALGAVWVVLDVVPSPGIPAARFIYTNQEVLSVIEPAVIDFLSFSSLTPTIKKFRLNFMYPGCGGAIYDENGTLLDSGITPLNGVSYLDNDSKYFNNDARLTQMAEQITQALTPNSRLSLWGDILYVGSDHRIESPELYTFSGRTEGALVMSRHERTFYNPDTVYGLASVALSIFLGVAVAIIAIVFTDRAVTEAVRSQYLREQVRGRVLLKRINSLVEELDEKEEAEAAMGNATEFDDDNLNLSSALFERPIAVIDMLVIDALVRRNTDSIKTFVNQRCELLKTEGSNTRANRSMTATNIINLARGSIQEVKKAGMKVSADIGLASFNTSVEAGTEEQCDRNGDDTLCEIELRESKYMTLKSFFRRYERFCELKNLNFVRSSLDVKRRLVELGITSSGRQTERVYRMRWRSCNNPNKLVRARTAPCYDYEKISAEVSAKLEREMPGWLDQKSQQSLTIEDLFSEFVQCGKFVQLTEDCNDFVSWTSSVESRAGKKQRRLGLEDAFEKFAFTLGVDSISKDLHNMGATNFLPWGSNPLDGVVEKFGAQRKVEKKTILKNIKWRHFAPGKLKQSSISGSEYFLEFIKVIIHFCCLSFPAFVLMSRSLSMKVLWDVTSATGAAKYDPLESDETYQIVTIFVRLVDYSTFSLTTQTLVWFSLIYVTVAVVCLELNYIGSAWYPFNFLAFSNRVASAVPALTEFKITVPRAVFAIRRFALTNLMKLMWFIIMIWLCVNVVWCLLAAILDPTRFLPIATMVTVGIATLCWQYSRMKSMAAKLEASIKAQYTAKIRKSVQKLVNYKVALRRRVAEEERSEKERDGCRRRIQISRPGASTEDGDSATSDASGGGGQGLNGGSFDPAVLFDLLDVDRNEYLSEAEFKQMFDQLDISVSPHAHVNIDCIYPIT